HLACVNFLPALGTPRTWGTGRHRLDADKALGLILDRLRGFCGGAQAAALALPTYLASEPIQILLQRAEKVRLPAFGCFPVPPPVARALAAPAEGLWSGAAVVVDVDDHALTLATVAMAGDVARVVQAQTLPSLGLRVWRERLLNAVADRCIRQSRRDPRDSAD